MAEQEMRAAMAELGITVESEFVPWSKSRNKGEKSPSLNWRITLKHNGREVLTTDYGAGCGHAPSYKQGRMTVDQDRMVKWECEHGKRAWILPSMNSIGSAPGAKPLTPNYADVVHSLVLDGSAIDHGTFEDWAGDFGYDVDSRKAESVYRACLEIGLKLRSAFGDDGLRKLQEASQDY